MPTDASYSNGGRATSSRAARLGGFAIGIFGTLAIGLLVSVAWTGNGLSTQAPPPEQIYFP